MAMKKTAKDLFVRAYELSGKVREAYLQEACGNDAELRLEVQRHLVKAETVSYTHLTLPTIQHWCRSRWSPYH